MNGHHHSQRSAVHMPDPISSDPDLIVRHFRQVVLWPLQLMPIRDDMPIQKHCDYIQTQGLNSLWREVEDEFTGDPALFQERHYSEFITFLPSVQRFLYGEGTGRGIGVNQESPIRVFRRSDIAKVRMTYPNPKAVPITFEVAHVDLYFFYDIDIVILAMEIFADDLPLTWVEDTMLRFARGYPTYWESEGHGGHCLKKAEWLAQDGTVLAVSDYENKEKYLSFVCQYRAPCIASHWEFLFEPLVFHHSGKPGLIRYRQIESHLLPLMAYLTMDNPAALTRGDFIRLGLAAAPEPLDSLPYSEQHLCDFEDRYFYDRYWDEKDERPGTRFICSGRVFTEVTDRSERFWATRKTGLEQFRHEYFVLFLISHFHKASMLMLSDRLVDALNRLEPGNLESVRHFRRVIRLILGVFLRFTHRYWFHDVSEHTQVKELFRMTNRHLETAQLYAEVREAIEDMSQYLDSDLLRRQGETMVRLTVVTTVGLIGMAATGFLGMNVIAEADSPVVRKLFLFLLVLTLAIAVTIYTVLKSRRLSEFLEKVSDERALTRDKFAAFLDVWRTKHDR
jgi:CorA-like Mg2+ transporter protein